MKFNDAARISIYFMVPVTIALTALRSVMGEEVFARAELCSLCVLIPLHTIVFRRRWVALLSGGE